MDDATFQKELAMINSTLMSVSMAPRWCSAGKKIKERTSALFAGGELSEEDQANFIKEMEALFLDAVVKGKKFTPKNICN